MIEIPRRFCGPPDSANGGWISGHLAAHLGGEVEVTLRLPPPLEQPLELRDTTDGVTLLRDDDLVAEALPIELDIEPPAPVTTEEAINAERAYVELDHPFSTCFTCGTDRAEGDGLRVFSGPVRGRTGVVASRWVPDATLSTDGDGVDAPFVWAALDCPSGWSHMSSGLTAVLGRMAVRQVAPISVEEPYVVVGKATGSDGRKLYANSAIYDSTANVAAYARTTWIRIDA